MHRIIVIGRGLIGSAAARHLAGMTDGVALVGPDEPKDRAGHGGVFASHYDEGRMTRIVDPDPAWAQTAKNSIERYAGIEAESGVPFFTNSGYLGLGKPAAPYLRNSAAIGRELGAEIEQLDAAAIRARFPFLAIPDDTEGLWELDRAGHVSPRRMVEAQSRAAEKRGADILREEVSAVRLSGDRVQVETASGSVLEAERVLIATGAFTAAWGLAPVDLKLRVFGRTVLLARIDDDMAGDFAGMPTMGHAESGAYILPPILYPDGHRYLKIGIGSTDDPELDSKTGFAGWFKGTGSADNRRDFEAFLKDLFPPLRNCRTWHTDTCAVAWTSTGLPHIDFAAPDRIAVAVGGNGKGAKSSDDWGWIAAHLVAGRDWDHPVDRARLKLPG